MTLLRPAEVGRLGGLENEWHIVAYRNEAGEEDFFRAIARRERFIRECLPWGLVSDNLICHPDQNFLSNGAKAHFDTLRQFEYATYETSDAYDLLLAEKAGERIVEEAVKRANDVWREEGYTFRSFKNIRDPRGECRGVHENYYMLRDDDPDFFKTIAVKAGPFFISRFFAGSGWVDVSGKKPLFTLSQRADLIECLTNTATTSSRPLFNARDEPEGDGSISRRLHIIIADPLIADVAIFLRSAATSMVLDVIEEGYWDKDFCGSSNLVEALHAFSRDSTLKTAFTFENKKSYSMVDLQEIYRDVVHRYYETYGNLTFDKVLAFEYWNKCIDYARRPRPHEWLKPFSDWAARKWLIELDMARWGYSWRSFCSRTIIIRKRGEKFSNKISDHLVALDLQFAENGPRGYARTLVNNGIIHRLAPENQIQEAIFRPKPKVRSYARHRQWHWAREEAEERGRPLNLTVWWTHFIVRDDKSDIHKFTNMDPYSPKTLLPGHSSSLPGYG